MNIFTNNGCNRKARGRVNIYEVEVRLKVIAINDVYAEEYVRNDILEDVTEIKSIQIKSSEEYC